MDQSNASPPFLQAKSLEKLRWGDYALITTFCTLVFGFVAISGRPMTLHEARLPECCREMMMPGHSWLIPMNGPRPWLERPPLPHWIMMSIATVLGQHCDNEWSARIPPSLMGLLIVLLIARMTALWFGRNMGFVAGIMLATMYEFYYYSTLAEDDIFLAFVVVSAMAVWVQLEFIRDPQVQDNRLNPIAGPWPWKVLVFFIVPGSYTLGQLLGRPWQVLVFFILLGLTNLAKGPIVGAAVIIAPLAVYLLWQKDWRRMRRYFWVWGWLLAAAVALSWHVYIQKKYPEYWENLRYDFNDTSDFNEPWWYYPPQLLGVIMPWTPAALAGLWATAGGLGRKRNTLVRFLWCWAVVPIVVLSIPHRKHHHYLVPSLAPWAILAALGANSILRWMYAGKNWLRHPAFGIAAIGVPVAAAILVFHKKIPGPLAATIFLALFWIACVATFYYGQWKRDGRWILAAVAIGVGVFFNWGQKYWPDPNVTDDIFLRQANEMVPRSEPLIVNGSIGPLDFFRIQFYLRSQAKLVHNLSYLRGNDITSPDVWVVSRVRDLAALQTLGDAKLVAQSTHTRRETGPGDRFALFHIHYRPDLQRYSPPEVSPMQAMLRKPGPFCGEPLE